MQSELRQQYNCHVTGKQLGVRALLNLACIKRYIEFSLHQGSFLFPGQHLEVLRVTSGGSRRRECLKPAKKRALRRPERCAAQVLACLSTVEPPPIRRERRYAFSGSQVFGAGTLPVGFQGRSALVAEGEIPVQKTCTQRENVRSGTGTCGS